MEREIVDIAFEVNQRYDLSISPRVLTEDLMGDPVWGQTSFLEAVRRDSVAAAVSPALQIARHRLQRAQEALTEADVLMDRRGGGAR